MTTFIQGRTRAHVMEYLQGQWAPVCGRTVRPGDDDGWLRLRDVGLDDRLTPWCGQCVRAVRRRVDELVWDVLDPAEQEAS